MIALVRALVLAVLPSALARLIVNLMGFHIAPGARVGLSWIKVDRLEMGPGCRIGHFNRIRGPFTIVMAENAALGNANTITRGPRGVSVGDASLRLGIWAKITSNHFVDLTRSVSLGDYSIVAGKGCQIWTHGYVHEQQGIGRYRIDGDVAIGSNVYIGAMCFISMGVTIGNGIIVGGGTAVARDLAEPGLYVSSPVRSLPRPVDPDDRADLIPVPPELCVERVYDKKAAPVLVRD